MEAALELLLPKMLPDTHFRIHAHQGKADLLGKLRTKLKAYSTWIPPSWRIVVVIDRDDDDCEHLKQQLEAHAAAAGLSTRTTATEATSYVVVNRVAIEELEAWYFGDWKAVRTAFPRAPVQSSPKPDAAHLTTSRAERGKHSSACFNRPVLHRRSSQDRGGACRRPAHGTFSKFVAKLLRAARRAPGDGNVSDSIARFTSR